MPALGEAEDAFLALGHAVQGGTSGIEPLFLQCEGGWQPAWLEFARPLQLLFGQQKWKVNLNASPVG